MGAWIETPLLELESYVSESHPTWVRGLKLYGKRRREYCCVAPYVGAWIETIKVRFKSLPKTVAPYVGAWIETPLAFRVICNRAVAPYVGAWIET